jgi:hypothetical protein
MDAYCKIGDRLATDSIVNVETSAQRVADGLADLTGMEIPGEPHFWHKHDSAGKAMAHALKLREAGDLEEARLRFADLSIALSSLVKATGVPPSYPQEIQELHCPMYSEGQGGSTWLQLAGEVSNPFLGSAMLACFDSRTTLPVAAGAATLPDTSATQPATQPQSPSDDPSL